MEYSHMDVSLTNINFIIYTIFLKSLIDVGFFVKNQENIMTFVKNNNKF